MTQNPELADIVDFKSFCDTVPVPVLYHLLRSKLASVTPAPCLPHFYGLTLVIAHPKSAGTDITAPPHPAPNSTANDDRETGGCTTFLNEKGIILLTTV